METDKLKSCHGCLQVSSNPTDKLAVEMTHDLEIPQKQYIDKTVDVPVVTQGQVHAFQTAQKGPQVQFHDRVVDVPVARQRLVPYPSMPRERIQELIVEKSDVPVSVCEGNCCPRRACTATPSCFFSSWTTVTSSFQSG